MNINVFEGVLDGKNLKFGIVISRFNSFITEELLKGCIDGLVRHNVKKEDIDIFYVPGAFEIPLAARKVAKTQKYNAVIALGCVIRGATPHFEYVAAEVSKGISHTSLELEIPIIFGVLTTDTIDQAIERAGTKAGNKGFDAALSAIEMATLMKKL